MADARDAAATPSLLEAVMLGLDPAVEVTERTHGAKPAPRPAVVRKRSAGGAAEPARGPLDALRRHWPEYLMEAAGLGLYMITAGLCATLLWYPGSPVAQALPDSMVRRALMGVIMGLTAIAIIYSPWGQQSGAHINPAVTLTFWRLGKVATWDAVFYALAQFAGGAVGVLTVLAPLGAIFADPPVSYVATTPGAGGAALALLAEAAISFGLMTMILFTTNTARLMRLPGRPFHHVRGAALRHEHEPRADARLGAAGQPVASALDLFRRTDRRHAPRGRGVPADPAHARRDLRQAQPPHASPLHLPLRLRQGRRPPAGRLNALGDHRCPCRDAADGVKRQHSRLLASMLRGGRFEDRSPTPLMPSASCTCPSSRRRRWRCCTTTCCRSIRSSICRCRRS
jgi:glycerol uptake facilitator-like aquaporin